PLAKVDDEGLTLHPRGVADIHLRAKREAQLEKLDAVPLDGPLLLLVIEPDLAVRVAHESDSVRVVAVDVGSHMFWVPVLHGLIADIERRGSVNTKGRRSDLPSDIGEVEPLRDSG